MPQATRAPLRQTLLKRTALPKASIVRTAATPTIHFGKFAADCTPVVQCPAKDL